MTLTPNLTYLACPYSDPNPRVREWRFEQANKAAGWLLKQGYMVFSPISHTHPIATLCNMQLGWEFWADYDRTFLSYSSLLVVLMLMGWENSIGIREELVIAKNLGVPIKYLQPYGINDQFMWSKNHV